MKFDKAKKIKCENVSRQIEYWFISFHPSTCGFDVAYKLGIIRMVYSPIIGALFPLLVSSGLNSQPDTNQICMSTIKTAENQADIEFSLASNDKKRRPEITIMGMSKSSVMTLFTKQMTSDQFMLKRRSDSFIVLSQLDTAFASTVGYMYEYPELRYTYYFKDIRGGIRISGNLSIVMNADSSFEGISDITDDEVIYHIQKLLNVMKDKIKANT
jgi:hypothetical protein